MEKFEIQVETELIKEKKDSEIQQLTYDEKQIVEEEAYKR
jgi:hypothetical protein